MSRLYGALYFHMPDGEIHAHDLRAGEVGVYPRAAEQVRRPPGHGCAFTVVRHLDENGDIDTGFGLLYPRRTAKMRLWRIGKNPAHRRFCVRYRSTSCPPASSDYFYDRRGATELRRVHAKRGFNRFGRTVKRRIIQNRRNDNYEIHDRNFRPSHSSDAGNC